MSQTVSHANIGVRVETKRRVNEMKGDLPGYSEPTYSEFIEVLMDEWEGQR
jgi:hypothetical protein